GHDVLEAVLRGTQGGPGGGNVGDGRVQHGDRGGGAGVGGDVDAGQLHREQAGGGRRVELQVLRDRELVRRGGACPDLERETRAGGAVVGEDGLAAEGGAGADAVELGGQLGDFRLLGGAVGGGRVGRGDGEVTDALQDRRS